MKAKVIIAFAFGLLLGIAKANATDPIDGKTIFTSRCAGCHNVHKVLTGPALAGVDDRHSIEWIINFVHSSQSMVRKGDKQAVALYEQFNKVPMPDHPDLTEDNIKNIVAFIKTESVKSEKKVASVSTSASKSNNRPISLTRDFWPLMGLAAAILLLFGTLLFAVRVKNWKK